MGEWSHDATSRDGEARGDGGRDVRDFWSEVAGLQVAQKVNRKRFCASHNLKVLEEVDWSPGHSRASLRPWGLYCPRRSA